MEGEYFFLVFAVTVLIIRITIYLFPISSPTIMGFRLHHYMYAIVIIPLGIFLENVIIYSVGIGMFVDELGYLFIGGENHKDNYSRDSLILLCIFVVLIYLFKKQFVFWQ